MADTFIDEMEELLTTMRKELLEKMSEDNSDFKSMVNAMGGKDSVDIAADDIAFKRWKRSTSMKPIAFAQSITPFHGFITESMDCV